MNLRLSVRAEVRPTEDRAKVERAINNIFPMLKLDFGEGFLIGESTEVSALDRFHRLLRQLAILDAARGVMVGNVRGNETRFKLNKQVAFAGKVSFSEEGESPLGPIIVSLEAPDIERLIDYLAPKTKEGEPIKEVKYEE